MVTGRGPDVNAADAPSRPSVSAYVPCLDNRATVLAAVRSLQAQTVPPDELFVVDDASTDGSPDLLEAAGIRVLRLNRNCGRGAVRARAFAEARGELVANVDATSVLPPDFLARVLPRFADPEVAGVFGRMVQPPARTLAERWRGRHLLRLDEELAEDRRASLSTWGTVLRRDAVLAAGNFDPRLRHSEDADLGRRLLACGHAVVFDPAVHVIANARNSLPQVLERYWRWHAGVDPRVSWRDYRRQLAYAVRVLAPRDLAARDWAAVAVSLCAPHYQFWRSWRRLRGAGRGRAGAP